MAMLQLPSQRLRPMMLAFALLALPLTVDLIPLPAQTPATVENKAPLVDSFGDPLPDGAIARLGTVRLRHGGDVHWLAFSPDGKALLSNGGDRQLRIWEVASGKELLHYTAGLSARLSPDGRLLVSPAGNYNDFSLWEARTAKHIRRFGFKKGYGGVSIDFQFSPDGRRLVSIDNFRDLIHLWDVSTGQEIWQARADKAQERADQLLFSPDGKTIASVSHPGKICLWDAASGKLRHDSMKGDLHRVTFSPDGAFLAAAEYRKALRVWDVASGAIRHEWPYPNNSITSLAFAPDGKALVTADYGTVRVWDLASGKQRWLLANPNPTPVLVFRDSHTVVSVTPDSNRISHWDIVTGKELRRMPLGRTTRVGGSALSPDSKVLALGMGNHTISLFDLDQGRELHPGIGLDGHIHALNLSPDGKILAAGGWDWGEVHRWDFATLKRLPSFPVKELAVRDLLVGHDKVVVCGRTSSGDQLRWCDIATGKEQYRQQADEKHHQCRAMSPDGRKTVWLNKKDNCWLEALPDRREIGMLHLDGVRYVIKAGFAPDSNRVAVSVSFNPPSSGKYAHGLQILDLVTGRRFPVIHSEHDFWDISFSPDGRMVVTYPHLHGYVDIWEAATGRRRLRLHFQVSGIPEKVLFSPDGKLLALSTHEGRIQLWDVATDQVLACLSGHRGPVNALCFSPDSTRLISASWDTTALVWDVAALRNKPHAVTKEPAAQELEKWWSDLGSTDAELAYRVVRAMAAAPKQAVAMLTQRVQPVQVRSPEYIKLLILDLDHKKYARRQMASLELQRLGDRTEQELRKVLAEPPSLEVEQRVKVILEKVEARADPDLLRSWRAVETLERIGRPALPLLRRLAQGAPGALATEEAEAAVRRLER
jgi:WD40 repeat protein